jgi:hypothetical protein
LQAVGSFYILRTACRNKVSAHVATFIVTLRLVFLELELTITLADILEVRLSKAGQYQGLTSVTLISTQLARSRLLCTVSTWGLSPSNSA